MSNKLIRRSTVDREDPIIEALQKADRAGGLSVSLAQEIRGRLLLRIRDKVQRTPALREILSASIPPAEMKEDVMREVQDLDYPGAEHLLEEAVDILLEELKEQRATGASIVLIHPGTGRAMMPLRPSDIFTPTPYVDDNGVVHAPTPILHPGLSSGIALAEQEMEKRSSLLEMAKDPRKALGLSHLTDPDLIARVAVKRLSDVGIVMVTECDGASASVEFGMESSDAELQSFNPAFHRAAAYAAVLASKIRRLVGGSGEYSMGPVRLMKNSKKRWYTVDVTYRSALTGA